MLVNVAFRESFLRTGSGDLAYLAYLAFLAFYVVCVLVIWAVYLRPSPSRLAGV